MTIPPPADIRRIAFLGTPDLSVRPLRALVDAGFEVPLVVTRADTRRGRGGGHQPSPVKAAALELGLTDACRAGAAHLVGMWGHPDQDEGPRAFAEKRDPQWQPLEGGA